MAHPYRSPGLAPQLGGGGPLPPLYGSSGGPGAGGGFGGFSSPAPAGHAYDQSRMAPADMYGAPHAAGGYARVGTPPSYCQMQDYLNGGGHAFRGGGMYMPNSSAPPIPHDRWGHPQHAGEGLYRRGLPGDGQPGRSYSPAPNGHALPNQYAWHSPPTPPRERRAPEAPVGLSVQPEGSWEILTEENGWQPWLPGVKFYGYRGEEVQFRLGAFSYFVVFDSEVSGTQLNLVTGIRRPVRRRVGFAGWDRQEGLDTNLQQERQGLTRDSASPGKSGISLAENARNPPLRPNPQQPRPGQPLHRSPGDEDGMDSAAAYDLASEAYRELQKLGQGRTAPEQPEGPEIIVLGDVPVSSPGSPDSSAREVQATAASEPDAISLLEDLRVQQQALESKVGVILEALEEEAVTPGQAKDKLAQIEAKLAKLQCNGIDCVSTAGLPPGTADEVRAQRKELTAKAESLQLRLDEIFIQIKSMSNK